MATIASKHLSHIAQQGRGPDTELVHVTEEEKQMLLNAGGSGTINPNTGLREYLPQLGALVAAAPAIGAAAAVAGVGLAAYSSWKQGSMEETANKAKMTESLKGIENLNLAEEQLDRSVISQRKQAEEEYRLSNEALVGQTTSALTTADVQGDEIKQNVDMYHSGTADAHLTRTEEDITSKSRLQQQGLISQLGKSVGSILGDYYGEKQRIKSEKDKLQSMYDLSKKQSESWYLGKHLQKASQTIIPGGEKGYDLGRLNPFR